MIKETGFDIILSSDYRYEHLCAEIYFNREFVALITQEEGLEQSNIEIHPPLSSSNWTFKYSEFLKTLQEGLDALKK